MVGDLLCPVGGVRGRDSRDFESAREPTVESEAKEVTRGDRHSASPRAQGAVERAKFGEAGPWRINHGSTAGHCLAYGPVAGLGDDGITRSDEITAGPVGRRYEMEIVGLSPWHGVITQEMDSLVPEPPQSRPVEIVLPVTSNVDVH